MATRLLILIGCLTALVLAGCGGGGGDDKSTSGQGAAGKGDDTLLDTRPTTPEKPIDGRFDVGGHKLHLTCVGGGSPTVVYLHPYARDDSSAGGRDAGQIPELLRERTRVCTYDRANVERSGKVVGRQTGEDAVRDLHQLLAAAKVNGPYVLLGSGFGGLLADMYAATYPNSISGMVMVDGRLPGDVDVWDRFFPPSERIQPLAWASSVERLDQRASYAQATRLEGDEPHVPLTYIGPKDLGIDPSLDVKRITALLRDAQATFLERFDPGKLVLVDAVRPMEAVVPDRIAEEVAKVVDEARKRARDKAQEASG
jgi:pimeloyl-ACP methyl ester carboxylesterase